MGKISQYTRALKAKLSDLFVVASSDNGSLSTKAVTTEQIGNAIITEQTFSGLDGKTPAEALNSLVYNIGDELSISNVILCGYTSNSAQRVQFFVPLSKPMSNDILNANISIIGDFTMYSVNASEGIVNSSTVGSWTINKKDNGLYCRFDLNSQFTTQNRTVVAVLFGTGSKITFA